MSVYVANSARIMMIMIIMRTRRMFITIFKNVTKLPGDDDDNYVCVYVSTARSRVVLKPSEVIGTIISGFNAVFSAQSPSQRSANTSFNLLRTYSNLVQQEHQRRFKMLSQLSTKSKIQLTLQASQLHHDSIPIEQSNRSKLKQ